jgi:hypothetical protein
MPRRFLAIPLLFLLIFLFACASHNHHTNPAETGKMPIQMSLTPALQQGFNVTRVNVRITKGDFTEAMDMAIDSTNASGTFEELEMGTYAIDVSVWEDSLLIATGQGTGTVSPGQTTTVYITLQFTPGGLQVIISWGLPYAECRRVLFVGNSHTYFNSGVNTHLQSLLNAVHPEWGAVIQAQTGGGYYLQNHCDDPNTIAAIENGNWDLVILQEQSSRPMNDPDLFYAAATELDSVITHSGALTGFYMTWAWKNNPEMYEPIRDAYNYIGAYLDALVAPCGICYHNSVAADSTINLYAPDNYHPSLYGTYMVACTFLASIWDVNPIGNTYVPAGINANLAEYLQTIAWTTVQAYHNGKAEQKLARLSSFSYPQVWQREETELQLAQ